MLEPSRAEQSLTDFAREEFGDFLTQFLLAGLGEESAAQRWQFNITFTGENETLEKRHVQVITHEPTDGSSCLPRGRDPLVLLALFRLLKRDRQAPKPELLYSIEDILSLLEWENTEERREQIDGAIHRYSLLMYQWEMNRPELSRHRLSFYKVNEHAITSFQTVDEEIESGRKTKRTYNRVGFNEFFINGLRHRKLFGVDWNNVRDMRLA
jgi:hypothetical protein